jgi:hypothetical protein
LYNYAKLKVLCSKKPIDFDFFKLKDTEIDEIVNLLEKEHKFFRK